MAQMARYLPYLECRAMNLIRPASQVCDCEKLADKTTDNLPNPNHTPSHHLIRMDEFFEISTTTLYSLKSSSNVLILKNESAKLKGYYQAAWKPPDSALQKRERCNRKDAKARREIYRVNTEIFCVPGALGGEIY